MNAAAASQRAAYPIKERMLTALFIDGDRKAIELHEGGTLT